MKRNIFRKIHMPHRAVNGTLYMAVRYRYNVTVIFPLKIEKKFGVNQDFWAINIFQKWLKTREL